MKLSERVLDAMSGIDEKLLKDSEEYTGKTKAFDFRILIMSAAVILLAVIIMPRMPKSNAAAPAAADKVQDFSTETVNEAEYPAEAMEAEEEKSTETAAEYGAYGIHMTEELNKALQTQKEVMIIAEPAEEVSAETLHDLCIELNEKGYEAAEEDGKLLIRTAADIFKPEDMPSEYEWHLDVYH